MERKPKGPDVKDELSSLAKYRSALDPSDQAVFDKLLDYARNHVSACAKSERNLLESMLLAMVLEQQKRIDALTNSTQDTQHKTRERRPHDVELGIIGSSNVRHELPWAVG